MRYEKGMVKHRLQALEVRLSKDIAMYDWENAIKHINEMKKLVEDFMFFEEMKT